MIAFVRGPVAAVTLSSAVLEVGGVGLELMCTPGTLATLSPKVGTGQTATLPTSMVVREDSLTLFGFLDEDEKTCFELLQTASGVGPKLAQAMLAVLSPDDLRAAVSGEDVKTQTRVPGIGQKGAQRIILELKDRLGAPVGSRAVAAPRAEEPWRDQVRQGLQGLGWSAKDADRAVDEVAPGPGETPDVAALLRAAYVDPDPAARVTAIRTLWGDAETIPYDRQVLTAYAAARIPANDGFAADAGPLIASMLTAGLDRDAARWREIVDEGDAGWGLLAVGLPGNSGQVSSGEIDSYRDNDATTGTRRTRMLVAGLAGLGRISDGTRNAWDRDLDLELGRETRWSALIDRAGEVRNAALVTMLMGVGMQGDDWSRMTPRHLYHIVSALRRSGMEAEARMIAAEALART